MAEVRTVIPDELVDAARNAAGAGGRVLSISALVRLGLARLAGLPDEAARYPAGGPRRPRDGA